MMAFRLRLMTDLATFPMWQENYKTFFWPLRKLYCVSIFFYICRAANAISDSITVHAMLEKVTSSGSK